MRHRERNDIKDKRRNKKTKGREARRRGDFQWTQCGFLQSTRDLKLNKNDWIKVTCAGLLAEGQDVMLFCFLIVLSVWWWLSFLFGSECQSACFSLFCPFLLSGLRFPHYVHWFCQIHTVTHRYGWCHCYWLWWMCPLHSGWNDWSNFWFKKGHEI